MEKAPKPAKSYACNQILESMPGGYELQIPCPSFRKLSSPESEPQQKSAKLSRSKSKNNSTVLRRSRLMKNAVVQPINRYIDFLYEDLTVSDSDNGEPVLPEPEANSTEQSLEGKFDCVLERLQAVQKVIQSLQSKVDENIGLNEAPSSASDSYRTMSIDCQKKIEALTNENRQLTEKLENALGKVEMFEKTSQIFFQALDKMKDVILISNLARTSEAAVNASASGAKTKRRR